MTQSQPGTKPFVFGAERSTSTSSSPERPQTFFDCLEEQDERHDTSSGNLILPMPAHVTTKTGKEEAEERPPGSEAARTFNKPAATTLNKFARIGNGLEPFNIIDPSTGSGNAPSSLFGNPQASGSKAATMPSGKDEKPGGIFGLFEAPKPAPAPSIFSGNTASNPFGHPAPAQTPDGLPSASATSDKHEHQGAGFGKPNARGSSAQFIKDPPSVFDLPPPQAGKTSSSLFANNKPSSNSQTPSAPSKGTSLFGGAARAPASGRLFGASTHARTSGGLFEAPAPAQASGKLFGASTNAQMPGDLFGTSTQESSGLSMPSAPAQTSSGLFETSMPAQTSGGLFGASTPAHTSDGLFGGSTPAQKPGSLFGAPVSAQPSGSLFGTLTPAQKPGGLFGALVSAQPSGSLFGNLTPAQPYGGLFGTSTPAQASGGLFGALKPAQTCGNPSRVSAPARASGATEAGAPHELLGQDVQTKTDNAWTQQQAKIQLALSSIQDAQILGQEAQHSFQQERHQWQDQIMHLEKQLEEKQVRIVAMTEQIEQANEKANEQTLQMRRYSNGCERMPSGPVDLDEWFFDCATNRKFRAMYACLRQMFSGELHPEDFLAAIKPEDVWYDPYNLCLRREVFLKDGYIYLRKSEGPSVASDAGTTLAGSQFEQKQNQITDMFKPNIQPEASSSDKKDELDAGNVVAEPAASGNGSKAKPAKDLLGKIIKGRHGRIMSLGPSASQIEETPSLAKLSEASRTETTKASAGIPSPDENSNHIKPTPIRSRSDSTPLPVRGKRSSSARPISKDENDSAKQTSTPAIRPLIKEEWLTNEQRVSRIRKAEDETVERAMLRKRQQKGQ